MDAIVPWKALCRLIEPHYPTGDRGRPPVGIERMLRIYFLQVWFNLPDPGVEDALYDGVATPGPVHDSRVTGDILHGDETRVWGDSAYQGQREAILAAASHAQDFTHHRGNRRSALGDEEVAKNRTKSRVRAHVEHPLRILKCVFGFRKVCYRGIARNLNRPLVSFARVNLYMKRRALLRCAPD